jgi:photosystem II stability/assembly factor-like uncharacterized protein
LDVARLGRESAAVFAIALVGVAAAHATARGVSHPRSTIVPYAVAFWDARAGLLGTGECRAALYGSCERGAIERTTDGGRTFQTVLHAPRPVIALQMLGPRGAIATLDGGRRYRTLNRGRSWQLLRLGRPASFATQQVGLSFRSYMTHNHLALALLAARDGGRSWHRRASPCTQAVAFNALIDLVTPRLGWLVCLGQPGAGNQEKAVFRTRDGGATWQPRAAAVEYPRRSVRGGIGGYGYPEGISFAVDGFGLLWESRGTLYVTRDGGAHWQAKPRAARPEIDFGRGAAAFRGGLGFVLLARGGGLPARLLETRDSGRSWHTVQRWSG